MKVVGLLSGGKDSCFNLCHCVAQGHEIVALASLGPEGGKEEIDSYLYQTVGQDGLHFIAQALELPLFRRSIRGTAVDQESDYAATTAGRAAGHVVGDETEDLYLLLQDVLAEHPDVKGVSVGAILSNYQRVRVEHVCARLNLQSLSYLWQYDQSQLLIDMDCSGMESIIIKVAGAGLGIRHLGKNVCGEEMRETLQMLNEKWGTHPAGEGGEYETFTVDCPLFKKRISLTETEPVILSSGETRDDIGTVAYLRLKAATLVDKSSEALEAKRTMSRLPIPKLLDEEARRLLDGLEEFDEACNKAVRVEEVEEGPSATSTEGESRPIATLSENWLGIGNVSCRADSLEAEVRGCFRMLQEQLSQYDLNLTSIAHINLYLTSMSLFPSVNAVYNTFFGPSPPTRACVSALLPPGTNLKLDVLAHRPSSGTTTNRRIALHVRGLSYWAPANIGPYSQCVAVGERLFIAGQIGLQPYDLSLPSSSSSSSSSSSRSGGRSFAKEAALALQHVRRIIAAMQEGTGGGYTGWMESCICWVSGPQETFEAKRDAARKAWKMWTGNLRYKVPFLLVQVPELPRGAMVEWQVTWQTGRKPYTGGDESDEEEGEDIKPISNGSASASLHQRSLQSGKALVSFASLATSELCTPNITESISPFSLRAFYTRGSDIAKMQDIASGLFGEQARPTSVQVLNIATAELDNVKVAFCAFAQT